MEGAYKKMGPWEEYLKEEFQEAGVPEKFRYLLIPESHGKFRARSSVGAVGPYQFMPQTGRSYGLDSRYYGDCHPNIEERQDPIKSAQACAELLRDL
ncbi:MAG: transglycosylase SLT domain-containing protein, partial [Bacteroidales bacterium]